MHVPAGQGEEVLDEGADVGRSFLAGEVAAVADRGGADAARPAVTLTASNTMLADLITGRQSVAEAIEHGHIKLTGSKTARRRMFDVIGFPLVRLGF